MSETDNKNPKESHIKDLKDSIENMDANPKKSGTKKERSTKKASVWDEILSYIKILIISVVIAFAVDTFIIINAEVPTASMKDTIMEHDRIIGFRFSYLFENPKRGDIIIFKYPDNEKETYVKRLIGVPGDIIEIMKDMNGVVHVYVNGNMIDEPYLYEPMIATTDYQKFIVPSGHYFAMGDNRNSSLDSRYWENKYIARDKILAKAIFKYYKNFKVLK